MGSRLTRAFRHIRIDLEKEFQIRPEIVFVARMDRRTAWTRWNGNARGGEACIKSKFPGASVRFGRSKTGDVIVLADKRFKIEIRNFCNGLCCH